MKLVIVGVFGECVEWLRVERTALGFGLDKTIRFS